MNEVFNTQLGGPTEKILTTGGAVSASLNLVRCAFGAVGTGVIQQMYSGLGAGWTFVLLTGLCLCAVPLSLVVIFYGPGWRAKREERREREQHEQHAASRLRWGRHKHQ